MQFFKTARPYIIAGPCSAETREQVLESAKELAQMNVHLMRAGVWKPRTRPGSFEGNGAVALEWLQEAKIMTGLPVTIEVAEPAHIELALKYGIDVLWIGARTVVNPFQVQRLADALKGVDIPVMVKNPVNPDVTLWQGAIERIEQAGIKNVAAVHRGFSGYTAANGYRNQPNWPIPIELKRRMPELSIFCDPSHITGNRNRIAEVAQKALDMHFDGLMIETHPDPANAWSDADQQITPAQLSALLAALVVREEHTHNMSGLEQLEHLRQLMDSMDAEIIDLVARRMELSSKIGAVKNNCNMTVYQPVRWREIVETRGERGLAQGLTKEFVVDLYEKIHHESIRLQLAILDQNNSAAEQDKPNQ
jgi:chorismate mutase